MFPEHLKEYETETSLVTGDPVYKDFPMVYSNDNIIRPTICNVECDVLYSELDREENDVNLKNHTPFGYLRMIFKSQPVDLPMYLDEKLTIPCLTIEQKGETDANMYGYIPNFRYVYSSPNDPKFTNKDTTRPVFHGVANIIKTMNVYYKFDLDEANPYKFWYGMYINDGWSGTKIIGNATGDAVTDLTTSINTEGGPIAGSNSSLINTIIDRARNYTEYNKKDPLTGKRTLVEGAYANNFYEYFDLLQRGSSNSNYKDRANSYYHVPTFESIESKFDPTTQALINTHIKLGQIFILDQKKNLDNLLVNNGIMIISADGHLDIGTSISASIINNGIIIVQDGGKITTDNGATILTGDVTDPIGTIKTSNGSYKKIRHFSNINYVWNPVKTEDGTYSTDNIRSFKVNEELGSTFFDHLHSVVTPAYIRNMSAKFNISYEKDSSTIFSKVNCLFVSTNAASSTIPRWDNRKKKLDFELVSPSVSADGVLAEPYYNFFIPDYLIEKWWKINRKTVEDNLGTTNGIKIFRIDNNTGALVEAPIITDKIVNSSMSGLMVKIDIHGISW